jgi:ABC-type multidrug transport system permease subunit
MVYWMAGFTASAGAFFMYTALLLVSGLVFGAMFIVLAALCPTLQVAGGLSGVIILLLILLSGYAIVRQSIPGWWIWGFWINPMSWGFRAVTTNEFLRSRWDFSVNDSGMRAGDVSSRLPNCSLHALLLQAAGRRAIRGGA